MTLYGSELDWFVERIVTEPRAQPVHRVRCGRSAEPPVQLAPSDRLLTITEFGSGDDHVTFGQAARSIWALRRSKFARP